MRSRMSAFWHLRSTVWCRSSSTSVTHSPTPPSCASKTTRWTSRVCGRSSPTTSHSSLDSIAPSPSESWPTRWRGSTHAVRTPPCTPSTGPSSSSRTQAATWTLSGPMEMSRLHHGFAGWYRPSLPSSGGSGSGWRDCSILETLERSWRGRGGDWDSESENDWGVEEEESQIKY